MSDDVETVDGNSVYKHMRKLYSEKDYRLRFNRIDYMTVTPKQREIFNSRHKFLGVRAGNRSGKTEGVCIYQTCALLGRFPSWYEGFEWKRPAIARSVTFNSWIIGPTSVNVRDVQQAKLLGGLTQSELGTGWIPLSALSHPIQLSRGVSGLADRALITRDDGTIASLSFKTHEMSREAFQGDAVDLFILDEDPGKRGEEIWPELTARIIGTGGRGLHTATPLAGVSPIRKFFREPGHPERGEIRMSIYDNSFLTAEDIKTAESSYSERERATRLFGDDLPGFGAVFNFEESSYLHDLRAEQVPSYWKWLNAVDFSHNGLSSQAHPFAFVSCAIDPSTDIMYVMHSVRIKQQLPPVHVAALRQWGAWDGVCAWPKDGLQRDSGGSTFCGNYKALGMQMRSTHATLPDGSVSIEAALALMEGMFATGKLKIARSLLDLREEIRDLHYDQNNRYVAESDDLASALRYACMDRRYARALDPLTGEFTRPQPRLAQGLDFDLF